MNTKSQDKSAQTKSKIPCSVKTDTKPDFSHRLNGYYEDGYCLEDAAYHALDQANSIINTVQLQFTGETETVLTDEMNFYSLEAARNAILDVKAIIAHYVKHAGDSHE